MSGIFAGKGLNRDSNEAYRKSKICELHYLKKLRKLPRNERVITNGTIFRKILKVRLTQVFGYGYKWEAPTLWFIGMVSLYGLIGLFHNNVGKIPFIDSVKTFCYSLYNSMSPYEKFLDKVNLPWASFESVAGILLIGFLGFIIANNIRNDS